MVSAVSASTQAVYGRKKRERERGKEGKGEGVKVTWISSSGDWNI